MVISQFPEKISGWNYDQQGVTVPGSEKEGYSPIYRCAINPDIKTSETLYDIFHIGREKSPNKPCLGHRPWDATIGNFKNEYTWLTYAEVEELRTAVGSGVCQLVTEGKLGEDVKISYWTTALWCQNRPEFQIIEQSCHAYSRYTVGLYDSYDQDTAVYVISHSEAKACFTTSSHVSALLSASDKMPLLKLIVLLDTQGPTPMKPGELATLQLAKQWAAQKGITLLSWKEIIELGRKKIVAHCPPASNEELTGYCYTSGTTGKPKAAKVRHCQLAVAGAVIGLLNTEESVEDDVMISYLPLAHIYERMMEMFCFREGAAIGYFSGDVLRLIEDIQILKPTVFPAVPRILKRIGDQISAQMEAPGLKGKLLRTAVNAKIANHDRDGTVTHAFYDRVVFRKVKAVLGGRVRFICSGSAPLRPELLKLLRVCFCCRASEGYGQTENSGTCLMMVPGDKVVGSCGCPVMGIELRLKDCPDLGYTSKDQPMPRGELLSRGQTVFDGYYKDEEKTKETIDEEGWLHSGDVAAVDSAGRFYIVDRIKNLIKLSQGEYVAIENVEQRLSSVKQIAQLWLYGDSTEDHLVAIAVPDPEVFAPFASRITGKSIAASDAKAIEAACNDEKVTEAILHELENQARQDNLKGFEIPKAVKLRAELFTAENGFLTPTFKMKRPEARKMLAKEIEELYGKKPQKSSSSKM